MESIPSLEYVKNQFYILMKEHLINLDVYEGSEEKLKKDIDDIIAIMGGWEVLYEDILKGIMKGVVLEVQIEHARVLLNMFFKK
jgi:hypothetical protein